ncbi:hypothetical protein F2P79_006150 [Pimephales promelas]|nr:hypothetical protein F2P79_006150 [Pimephales promelas]
MLTLKLKPSCKKKEIKLIDFGCWDVQMESGYNQFCAIYYNCTKHHRRTRGGCRDPTRTA